MSGSVLDFKDDLLRMSGSDKSKDAILFLLAFCIVSSLQVRCVKAFTETIQLNISHYEGNNLVRLYFTFSYLEIPSVILQGDEPALISMDFGEYPLPEGSIMRAYVWIDRSEIPSPNLARLKADQLIKGLENLISMDLNFSEYGTIEDESVYIYDLDEGSEMHSLFNYICDEAPGRMFAEIIRLTLNKNLERSCSLSLFREYEGALTYSMSVSYYYSGLYEGETGKIYSFDAKELMGYNGIFYPSPSAEQSFLQISLGEILGETEIKILEMKPSQMGMSWRNPTVGEKQYRVYTYEKLIEGSSEQDLSIQFRLAKIGIIDWTTTIVILLGFLVAIIVVGVLIQKRGKESKEDRVQ